MEKETKEKIEEMVIKINKLRWEDYDIFWSALAKIAREETKRKVIDTKLKAWWQRILETIYMFPINSLPKDD